MIRRPPRSTLDRSSAASDVYKRQIYYIKLCHSRGKALHGFVVTSTFCQVIRNNSYYCVVNDNKVDQYNNFSYLDHKKKE